MSMNRIKSYMFSAFFFSVEHSEDRILTQMLLFSGRNNDDRYLLTQRTFSQLCAIQSRSISTSFTLQLRLPRTTSVIKSQ